MLQAVIDGVSTSADGSVSIGPTVIKWAAILAIGLFTLWQNKGKLQKLAANFQDNQAAKSTTGGGSSAKEDAKRVVATKARIRALIAAKENEIAILKADLRDADALVLKEGEA